MAEPIDTPEAPAPVTTPDGRVYVRMGNGELASVPAEQAQTFVTEGRGAIATQADVHERGLQREFGEGIANEVTTGLEGAADAATLGLYSVGRRVIGGDAAADATRERRERSPLANLTGQALGLVGTAVATGGTGALGAVARATPGGMALRAGLAAEEAIAGTTALSRIGALTSAGALEGAMFGIGEGVSDAALSEDERDRMAEYLIVDLARRGGEGALLGALGGAAGGVAVEGLRGLAGTARKLGQRLRQSGVEGAGDEAGGTLLDGIVRQTDELADTSAQRAAAGGTGEAEAGMDLAIDAGARGRSGAGAEQTTTTNFKLGRPGEERNALKEFGEAATARNRFEDVHSKATDRVAKLATENARFADDMVAETNISLKRHPVTKALRGDPPESIDTATAAVLDTLEQIHGALTEASEKPQLYEKQGLRAFLKAREELETIAGSLRAPRDADELADVYIGLDRLKRRMGRIQRAAGSGPTGDRAAQEMVRQHYEQLRALLESDAVFGSGVTTMQREVNSAWTKYLDYASAYDQRFALSGGLRTSRSARDGFEKVAGVDPEKVGGMLRGAGDVEKSLAERDLVEGARLQAELLETLGKHYDVSDGLKGQAAQARRNAAEIAKELEAVKKVRAQADKWERTIGGLRDVPLIGTMLSGTVTTTGRAVASAESMSRVVALARIRAAAKSGASAVSDAVRTFVKRSGTTVRSTTRVAPAVLATKKDFGKIYAAVRDYEKDPAAAVRRSYRAQHGLGTAAPLLAAAYAAKTTTAAQFLADKLPRHEPPASIFDRTDESEPPDVSDSEMEEFMRYARAAMDPLSVVDDLEKLQLSPEAVEALRAVHPHLYQQIQSEVLDGLQEAEKEPPYETRLNLGVLFDLTTDPALEPEFLAMLQASAQASTSMDAQAQSGQSTSPLSPSQRSAPEVAGLAQTKSQGFQGATK
jgi:hypothetical protein